MDLLRRFIAAGLFVLGIVGLAPMLPLVFGYASASVQGAASTRPVAGATVSQFVVCQPPISPWRIQRGNSQTRPWLRCTNNWSEDLTVRASLLNNNGSPMTAMSVSGTIRAGETVCLSGTYTTINSNDDTGTWVSFEVTGEGTNASFVTHFKALAFVRPNYNDPLCQ